MPCKPVSPSSPGVGRGCDGRSSFGGFSLFYGDLLAVPPTSAAVSGNFTGYVNL